MQKRKFRIVADSSADILTLEGFDLAVAPLEIVTSERSYKDTADLDVREMVSDLLKYKGKSRTSCPNIGDYLSAFGDAEDIFCITITGTLSGSYNAACLAAEQYREEHPDRRVYVHNSLSTGPEMVLAIEKMCELIARGFDFDDAVEEIKKYAEKTGLMFMLASMKNLANNGRVSGIVAKLAGLLGIRVVGKASTKGDLEPLSKCPGEKNALATILKQMKKEGYAGGRVYIAHCENEAGASALAELIKKEFPTAEMKLYPCRGLCSFYAERGGILAGFEKE